VTDRRLWNHNQLSKVCLPHSNLSQNVWSNKGVSITTLPTLSISESYLKCWVPISVYSTVQYLALICTCTCNLILRAYVLWCPKQYRMCCGHKTYGFVNIHDIVLITSCQISISLPHSILLRR